MPTYFQRPENALKRANEFIDVGKKQPALDALYDVIKSKKHRTWQKIHEPIMEKYLTLCVELRKSHTAKEGLYQYKNICQQVNVKSLEDVVRGYLRLAEEKTEEARKASEQTVLDVDDLDNVVTPESLLLSAVSGEDTQARTDRIMLIPWVKFLWESYRQCLDLLRNNNRVEKLYQDIAQDAFRFCQKYQRKTEFRKLCDNLRNHLGLIQKHQSQTTAIDLNKPESQQLHLDTRLFQLDTAITMELWQEAYKAVEDIHSLMGLSKKPPKPQMMANYYQKLGLVFWKSGNGLFHACALHRLLQLSREQRKNLTQEEIQRMATRVLLATLAVPISPPRNDIGDMLDMGDTAMENKRKLANLLGLQTPPTRSQLVKDLVRYNVIPYVMSQVKDLYDWLEVEFHPLELCQRVSQIYEVIQESGEPELKQYVSALQDNTIMRLLKQISQIYETIGFARLASLVPYCSAFHLERVIVDASRNGAVEIRVDHATQALVFGGMVSISQQDEQLSEGPHLQDQASDQIRNQLSQMSYTLHRAVKFIRPMHMVDEQENEKQVMIQHYRRTARKEHERILTRRHIIEDRKEKLESITVQREKEEQDIIEKQQRNQREAEEKRLEREAQERQRKKELEKVEEIQRSQARERIKMLKQSTVSQKVFKRLNEEELEKLDPDEIMAKHVEQLEVEKKELQMRLKAQEKKVDFAARARRVEELPLLVKQYEQQAVEDRKIWEEMEEQRIAEAISEREKALESRDRLARMAGDKKKFAEMLEQTRYSIYQTKLADYEQLEREERVKRLQERKNRRKEERRLKWLKEREEEEQRKKDEELKRVREEEQERQAEEIRKKVEAFKAQEAKQAAKQKEIEEREEREKRELERGMGPARGGQAEEAWRRRPAPGDAPREIQRDKSAADEGNWRRGGGGGAREDRPAESQPWRPSRDKEGERPGVYRPPRRDVEERAEPLRSEEAKEGGMGGQEPGPEDAREPRRNQYRQEEQEDGESEYRRDRRDNYRDIRLDDPEFRRSAGIKDEEDEPRREPNEEREVRQEKRGPPPERQRGPPQEEPAREPRRDMGREDKGYGRDDRDFGRDDRGARDGRSFGRDDRGGRDDGFGRSDRGGRDDGFGGRDDRGFGGRNDRGFRDDRRGFGRDERGGGYGRDDRGGYGRREEGRWGDRGEERSWGRDGDRPRRDFRDDQGEDSGRSWRGAPRDDRGPARRGGDDWRGPSRGGPPAEIRRDRGPGRDEGSSWRQGGEGGGRDRGAPQDGDKWRRSAPRQDAPSESKPPVKEVRREPRKQEPPPPQETKANDDDGWETVVKRR
ncbi:eukaryotic translation initiation factor 3 subunit A-like [Patiria miniata]|uniref:Eukaryotic translation initiation factor 3 subunit A n=1 Tax=Patiria miniata TaxID=46514 RepID=A0A914B4U6_PATMI|nr:eukaryotic translation initiation factor 3 subunit A-like [Patiria miniata]